METIYLSYSSTSQFRTCPAQWAYKRLDRIEKIEDDREGRDIPVERDFGSWWHALRAVDAAARGTERGSLLYTPDEISLPVNTEGKVPFAEVGTRDLLWQRLLDWWTHLPIWVQDVWVGRLGQDPVQRLVELDARWAEQWSAELDFEDPVAVELRWERELFVERPDDAQGEGGLRYVLVGFIDEVYRDRKRSVLVTRDYKIHRALGRISRVDEMLDSQLSLYAWGAARRLSELGAGRVQATAYDRTRMVAPKIPVLTKAGKLAKSTTDYDVATYREWASKGQEYPGLKKDGSGAGVYEAEQAVIDRLSTPAERANWFTRSLTPLSGHTVRAHLQAALDSARAMSAARERHQTTAGAPRNFGRACSWCDFAPLCQAQLVGGPNGQYDLESMGLRAKA